MAKFFDTVLTLVAGTVVFGAVMSVVFNLALMMWMERKYVTDSYDLSKKPLFGLVKPTLVSDEEMKIIRRTEKDISSPIIFISFVVALMLMIAVVLFA